MKWFKKLLATTMMAGAVTVAAPLVETASPVSAHGDACSFSPESGLYWNFHNSCHTHDWCYGAKPYGRSEWGRYRCDVDFLNNMRSSCRSRYAWYDPRRALCYNAATVYYTAVRNFGGPAFWF